MILWFAIIFVAVLTAGVVLYPLLRRLPPAESSEAAEMAIYKDQLNELKSDVERGVITAEEAASAETEISRRLLEAAERLEESKADLRQLPKIAVGGIAAAALGLTIGLYAFAGSPDLPGLPLAQRAAPSQGDPALAKLILQVEEQLEKRPEDLRGWSVLAPAYMRMKRFQDAANAFQKAIRLSPPNAGLHTAFGEALTMSEAGLVSADAQSAFQKALEIDPKQAKARFYLGIAKYQDGDKEEALRRWNELLASAPADAPWRSTVQAYVKRVGGAEAEAAAEQPGARAPALDKDTIAGANEMSAEDRQQMIRGMVDRLASRLSEDGKDLNGWLRLIRARTVLGENDKAKQALSDARETFKDDSNAIGLLSEFAVKLGLETK